MRLLVLAAVGAATVLLALTGCSATGAGSTGQSTSNRTYTAAQLKAILERTESTLLVKGTIEDDKELKAAATKLKNGSGASGSGNVLDTLAAAGATIGPAKCAMALRTISSAGSEALTMNDVAGAEMLYGTHLLGISSSTDEAAVQDVAARLRSQLDGLKADDCSTLDVRIDRNAIHQSYTLTMAPVAMKTDADKTVAFKMVIRGPGIALTALSAVAVTGNLAVTATAISDDDVSKMIFTINTVFEAAN